MSIKDFEEDIKEVATSLKIEEGKTFQKRNIFRHIANRKRLFKIHKRKVLRH
jgi:hypothetical protein